MPDSKGVFSKAESAAAELWMEKHWASPGCPICAATKFQISDRAVYPLTYSGASVQLGGGTIYPHVLVTCLNCGNVMHFNAVVMGILTPAVAAEDSAVSASGEAVEQSENVNATD